MHCRNGSLHQLQCARDRLLQLQPDCQLLLEPRLRSFFNLAMQTLLPGWLYHMLLVDGLHDLQQLRQLLSELLECVPAVLLSWLHYLHFLDCLHNLQQLCQLLSYCFKCVLVVLAPRLHNLLKSHPMRLKKLLTLHLRHRPAVYQPQPVHLSDQIQLGLHSAEVCDPVQPSRTRSCGSGQLVRQLHLSIEVSVGLNCKGVCGAVPLDQKRSFPISVGLRRVHLQGHVRVVPECGVHLPLWGHLVHQWSQVGY